MSDEATIEDVLRRYARWLPKPPHLGMVRHTLREGWAHVEEDESGEPFLVNNHGGRIPLAAVRWDPSIGGSEMRSDDPGRGHRYGTVCDTVDAVLDGRDAGSAKQRIDDIADMLHRMHAREREMEAALAAAERCLQTRPSTSPADATELEHLVQELRAAQSNGDAASVGERLKGKAGALEKKLDNYRAIAVELGRLYEQMRGSRKWTP